MAYSAEISQMSAKLTEKQESEYEVITFACKDLAKHSAPEVGVILDGERK